MGQECRKRLEECEGNEAKNGRAEDGKRFCVKRRETKKEKVKKARIMGNKRRKVTDEAKTE